VSGGASELLTPIIVQNIQFGCPALDLKQAGGLVRLSRGRATFLFLRHSRLHHWLPTPLGAHVLRGWFYASAARTNSCTLAVLLLGHIP
jgi:hypothetical protein